MACPQERSASHHVAEPVRDCLAIRIYCRHDFSRSGLPVLDEEPENRYFDCVPAGWNGIGSPNAEEARNGMEVRSLSKLFFAKRLCDWTSVAR